MKKLFLLISFNFFMLSFQNQAFSQFTPPRPANPDQVEFYLITVSLGEPLYTRFGHTILQMRDLEKNRTYNFNWGIFSFDEGNFGWKFFKGILTYRLDTSSVSQMYRTYRYEKRKAWEEKINLTTNQKKILLDNLYENLKPENRKYSYQHFYDNCVTRVRDLIDTALDGKLKSTYTQVKSEKIFRDYVRENLNSPFFSGFFLTIVMNRLIDIDISKWEEMFYPEEMRALFLNQPAFDDDGNPIPGTSLLSNSKVIIDGPQHPASPINLYHVIYGIGIILCLFMGIMIAKKPSDHILNKISIRLSGICLILWGTFSTALGLIMTLAWLFSNHLDILHNANLWFFWPTDFIIVILGFQILFFGQNAYKRKFAKSSYYFIMTHLLGFFIAIALWGVGIIEQNISNTIFWLFPVALLLYSMNAKKIQTEIKQHESPDNR